MLDLITHPSTANTEDFGQSSSRNNSVSRRNLVVPTSPTDAESEHYVRVMVFFASELIILIVFDYFEEHFYVLLNVFFFFSLFMIDEMRSKKLMRNILETSFYFHKKPNEDENSFFHFLLLFSFAFLSYLLSLRINLKDEVYFINYYIFSVLRSLQIFILGSSIKRFLVWSEIVSQHQIRRGFFGLYIRVLILIRRFFMIPIWIKYSMVMNTSVTLCHFCRMVYVLLTFCTIIWMINDFQTAIRNFIYSVNENLADADPVKLTDKCAICLEDDMIEPILLPCGHVHCYSCTYKWLKGSATCPTCRYAVAGTKLMDFSDGKVPFSIILFGF